MHARTICKTGIADRIVPKSYVLAHFKASYRTQCCPENAETLMTRIRVRIRVCQQKKRLQQDYEQVMERASRQMCAAIFKKKMFLEKKRQKVFMTNYIPSDFKTISFEHFTLLET